MSATLIAILILASTQNSNLLQLKTQNTTPAILLSKQKDFIINLQEPKNQTVPEIPFPRRDPNVFSNLFTSTSSPLQKVLKPNSDGYKCTEFEPWALEQSWETNILKADSVAMQEFLAKYQQSSHPDIKQCYNDAKCVSFGDCCPDKDQYSLNKTYEYYKCFSMISIYYLISYDSTINYLLVSKCLPFVNNDTDIKEKCERDFSLEHPPVTSNEVGRFYLNEFCAKCNGDWNFTKWQLEFTFQRSNWFDQITHIRNLSDVADFMKLYIQNTMFKIPTGMSRPWICDEDYRYIDKCNFTGQVSSFASWEQVGCNSYTNPVGFYRNVFCKTCNREIFCEKSPHVQTRIALSFGALMDLNILKTCEDYWKEKYAIYTSLPINKLLSQKGSKTQKYYSEAKNKKNICQVDEFYDYPNERCRRLHCSLGLFLAPNSKCYNIFTSVFNITYKVHFSLIPRSGITEKEAVRLQYEVWNTTKKMPASKYRQVTLKYKPNNQTNQQSPRVVAKILFYVHFMSREDEPTLVGMEKDIETWFSQIRRVFFIRSFRIVKDLDSLKFSEKDLDSLKFSVLWNESLYKPRSFQNYLSSSPQRVILYSDIRTCPKVRLSYTEFTLNEDNLVIFINNRQVNLTLDRVELNSNGTPMICLSDYPGTSPNLELPTPDFVEIILSNVFLGISLLCLAMTLTTYAIFSVLRTLPGKCNIFLCCTLFTAQALLFLNTSDNEIVCAVIGSTRHFAWLSTFGWMSVCSFHMYRVFTRLLVWNNKTSSKIIVKYALTAYGLPLLVVGDTVIANMAMYGVRVTGYGLPNCYLNQQLQLLLVFALPLSLMIIFNTSLLSTTIYSLYKTSKQSKLINRDKQRVIVYLKLSSLTGITWVFGFLSMFFPHSWLKYIFIVTNASQGIYIFLSYTLNTNTLKLYAFKFPCLRIASQHERNVT